MARKRNPNGRLWQAIEATERRELLAGLREAGGNMTRAAEILGVDKSYVSKRLRYHGLTKDSYLHEQQAPPQVPPYVPPYTAPPAQPSQVPAEPPAQQEQPEPDPSHWLFQAARNAANS